MLGVQRLWGQNLGHARSPATLPRPCPAAAARGPMGPTAGPLSAGFPGGNAGARCPGLLPGASRPELSPHALHPLHWQAASVRLAAWGGGASIRAEPTAGISEHFRRTLVGKKGRHAPTQALLPPSEAQLATYSSPLKVSRVKLMGQGRSSPRS